MGHDSAWKKAATVTITAAMLPRRSRGLDDIPSTTDNLGRSILLTENASVTERAQVEGYPVLLRTAQFYDRSPYPRKRRKTQTYGFTNILPTLT
jgi:hypothetical protein